MRISAVRSAIVSRDEEGGPSTSLEVLSDDGARGQGAAPDEEALLDELRGPVGRSLLGADPLAVHAALDRLQPSVSRPALAATELALWDLIGNVGGAPLHQLWGGHADRIRWFCTVPAGGENETFQRPEKLIGRGLTAVAVELQTSGDIEPLRLARERLGEDITLAVLWHPQPNAHEQANQLMDELEDLQVAWLECRVGAEAEPLLRLLHDRARTVLVAAGASDLAGLWRLVLGECCDILRPHPEMSSMLSLWKAAALAESAGLGFMAPPSRTSVGQLAALHLSLAAPACEWWELVLSLPGVLEEPDADGFMRAPAGSGLGLETGSAHSSTRDSAVSEAQPW